MSYSKRCKEKVIDIYGPVFGKNVAKGDFGIEIELEGTGPLGTRINGWDVHEEGSLRAPGGRGRGGAEYVTRGAIAYNDVIPAVQTLADGLRAAGVELDHDAHRTSTHIHVNVQKMTIEDMLGFQIVFACVEPVFMALCGPKRDGNSFCMPSYDAGDLVQSFHDYCEMLNRGDAPAQVRGKYASLSTNRLHDLNTLEARCFPHSVNPEEVHKWCTWLKNIKEIVETTEDKSFRSVVKDGINDPYHLAMRVFGWERNQNIPDMIRYGCQEAYEFTRVLRHWQRKEEKKKVEPKVVVDDFEAVRPGQIFAAPEGWTGWTPTPPRIRRRG